MRSSTVLFAFMLMLAPLIHGACINNNQGVGGPFPNELSAQRVFTYDPATPADKSSYPENTLTVVQFNIQSGYGVNCQYDLDAAMSVIAAQKPHYYAAQETNVNVGSRCGCTQPQKLSDRLGMYSNFFRTFFYQDGMYGHGNGGIYKPAATRSKLFDKWSTERRGVIAQISYPPQFNGRAVIIASAHLQYDNEDTRQGQAVEIISFVQGLLQEFPGAIVIVPGDFYTEVGQGAYSIMLSYFKNSWNEYNGDRSGGFTYPSNMPTNRFDHVWYKAPADFEMNVKNFQIVNSQASDHRALSVTFAFPSNPSSPPVVTNPSPSGCASVITATKRTSEGSSWTDAGTTYQIYDVLVKNTGTCAIQSLSLSMTPPSGNSISSTWNIDQTTGSVTLGGALPAGASFSGSGVILTGSTFPNTFTFNVGNLNCGSSCSSGSNPTTPPAGTTPPVSGTCNVAITYGSITNPLIITNSGSKAIKSLVLAFSPNLPSNNWNLIKAGTVPNQFTIPDFGFQALSAKGQSYSSSGYYTTDAPRTVSVVSVSC